MSTAVEDILQRRVASLARRFHLDLVPPLVVARDLRQAVSLQSHGGGHVEELPGSSGRSLIWRRGTPDETSVWVEAADRDYRGRLKMFLEVNYAPLPIDYAGFGKFDVDHLRHRSVVLPGDFVRIEAVPRSINRSHGGGFERRDTGSTIAAASMEARDQRLMTFVMMLKLAGLKAPRTMADADLDLRKARHYFMLHGWSAAAVDDAVRALLTKAGWRR